MRSFEEAGEMTVQRARERYAFFHAPVLPCGIPELRRCARFGSCSAAPSNANQAGPSSSTGQTRLRATSERHIAGEGSKSRVHGKWHINRAGAKSRPRRSSLIGIRDVTWDE
jgi:hypothetical protein